MNNDRPTEAMQRVKSTFTNLGFPSFNWGDLFKGIRSLFNEFSLQVRAGMDSARGIARRDTTEVLAWREIMNEIEHGKKPAAEAKGVKAVAPDIKSDFETAHGGRINNPAPAASITTNTETNLRTKFDKNANPPPKTYEPAPEDFEAAAAAGIKDAAILEVKIIETEPQPPALQPATPRLPSMANS
jgi:hypothetical protein